MAMGAMMTHCPAGTSTRQPSAIQVPPTAQGVGAAAAHTPPPPAPARRRSVLHAGVALLAAPAALALLALPTPPPASASAEPAAAVAPYTSAAQGYSLQRPAAWEQIEKPGADALFRDPQRKSTNVGVTVLPVMIASLDQFGDLQAAGERLLAAERAKESTLSVEMVAQAQSAAVAGPVYRYEYELESTRGRKRIVSAVTIAGGKLYVLNGTATCDKASCAAAEGGDVQTLRQIASSFAVDPAAS